MSADPQRRATDRIDPEIALFVKEGDDTTRHWARNEITAAVARLDGKLSVIAQTVTDGNLQSVEDHADFRGRLSKIEDDVRHIAPLEKRVSAVEQNDAILAALATNRKWLIGAVLTLAGLIIAAFSVLAGLLT